jgi:hypothetical protein
MESLDIAKRITDAAVDVSSVMGDKNFCLDGETDVAKHGAGGDDDHGNVDEGGYGEG